MHSAGGESVHSAGGEADVPLHAHALAYQKGLEPHTFLDLVPLEWLHLTTQDVFFVDDGTDEELGAIVERSQARLAAIPSFAAKLGRPEVWSEAVVLRPEPAEPFVTIRDALRTAIGTVRGFDHVPGPANEFRPHISLAYANGDGSGDELELALDAIDVSPSQLTVDHVSLIRQERVQHLYRWDIVTTVPLGS